MALIECPECGKQISENAEACPNCGNPMKSKSSIKDIDAQFDSKKKEPKKYGCLGSLLIVGGVFIFGLMLMSVFNTGSSSSSSYTPPAHDKSMAWQMTQDFVEKRLSSPSTAEFPWSSDPDVDITQNGTTYNVQGYVDSENGFGAQIRTNFEAELRYDGGGTWSLISLEFE